MLDAVLSTLDTTQDTQIARLLDVLRIPSISTDPAYKDHCQAAAQWFCDDLTSIGFDASVRQTPGHPMVVAHFDGPGPHVLFYGHYDVQPVDPLDQWAADPFAPQIEGHSDDAVIRGRGSSDDKGQIMTFVEACRAWMDNHGTLPCKITIFLEGEEESGSPSLIPFMQTNAEELTADVALICDTTLFDHNTPAIVTRLRGMCSMQVDVTGPSKDLHSGFFGGPAVNPIRELSRALGTLHTDDGRVAVQGFYDGVPDVPADVLASWDALGFDETAFLGQVGLARDASQSDVTPLEAIWSQPTCEVNGIWGGYTGAGFKTVIPSQAHAKISCRLVGHQDPVAVRKAVQDHITAQLHADCSVAFQDFGASPASEMSTDHPVFAAVKDALTDEWPKPAAYIGCGGSIPIAGHFKTILGMDACLAGFGKEDDQIHSPNEKYDLRSFVKGARSWARVLDKLAG